MPMSSIGNYRAHIGVCQQTRDLPPRLSGRTSATASRSVGGHDARCHVDDFQHALRDVRELQSLPWRSDDPPRAWKTGALLSLLLLTANLRTVGGDVVRTTDETAGHRADVYERACMNPLADGACHQENDNPCAREPVHASQTPNLSLAQVLKRQAARMTRTLQQPARLDEEDRRRLVHQAAAFARAADNLCNVQEGSLRDAQAHIAQQLQSLSRARAAGAPASVISGLNAELASTRAYAEACPLPLLRVAQWLAAKSNVVLASARLALARATPGTSSQSLTERGNELLYAKWQVNVAEQEWFTVLRQHHQILDSSWLDDEEPVEFMNRALRFDRNAPLEGKAVTAEMAQDIYGEVLPVHSVAGLVFALAALRGQVFRRMLHAANLP